MSTKVKIFLMALVGFIATTLSTLDVFNVWYVAITTVAFVLMYAGKNWLLPSTSPEGTVNWRDILSGVIMAVSMALSSGVTSFLVEGQLNWHALWVAVAGAVVGYFSKTMVQKPNTV
jgi:hypothetical protein